MSKYGQVLKIFVMGEEYKGLQAIELANWSGKAFLGTREHLPYCSKREELSKAGIYILLSTDQTEDGVFQIYIGETDVFSKRISNHARNKDWWDKFLVFTSGDDNLTKAHVRFLEKELYALASSSGAPIDLMNSSEPGGANLPEADISYIKGFLDNMLFVLSTLGFDYFESPRNVTTISTSPTLSEQIEGGRFYTHHLKTYWKNGQPVKSFMKISDGKYIVEKGSYIRLSVTDSFEGRSSGYYAKWKKLIDSEKVEPSDIEGLGLLTTDISFDSPSAAGSVIRGKSTNGRTRWVSCENNKSLKETMIIREAA
ncbi:MAG: GIY-YIG nuclease family protein [Bdellovibrionaceae bacterium]|jgi:hypothetical protein|nr:GIY-YIG nuclease family protein [Pseudobdellovibrionaceae bacterium]